MGSGIELKVGEFIAMSGSPLFKGGLGGFFSPTIFFIRVVVIRKKWDHDVCMKPVFLKPTPKPSTLEDVIL